jgi:hypothetical protein
MRFIFLSLSITILSLCRTAGFQGPETNFLESEPAITGLKFTTQGHGLGLSMIVPAALDKADKLKVTLILKNISPNTLTWNCTNSFGGLMLTIIGGDEKELERTPLGKRLKGEGLGRRQIKLSPGAVMVTTVVIEEIYKAQVAGRTGLIAEWHDTIMSALGVGPDPNTALRVKGTVLIKQTTNGLSIYKSN